MRPRENFGNAACRLIHSGNSSNWDDALEFADVSWIEKPASFDEVLDAISELVERNVKPA